MKRTKIVATAGPSTDKSGVLKRIIKEGVDVVRFNLSHGAHEDHQRRVKELRRLSKRLKHPVAVLFDLCGPKIRTGKLQGGEPVELLPGGRITLCTRSLIGTAEKVYVSYRNLPKDARKGDRILLDDGLLELRVISTESSEVICEVVHGGLLKEHKGVNLPGVKLSTSGLTRKDKADLKAILPLDPDYIALSFVRKPADVIQLRRIIKRAGREIPIISKIEKPEAIDNLDAIIGVSDAVMVARGDLGVEMPSQQVPILQKQIISRCNAVGIPVITATQMLESMMDRPTPTRAEVSDVANAILDGSDAVMLSGETAAGRYPVRAVRMMASIIGNTERYSPTMRERRSLYHETESIHDALCLAATQAASACHARGILVFTRSGRTARILSQMRGDTPIFALTPSEAVHRQLALCWGVESLCTSHALSSDAMMQRGTDAVLRAGYLKKGNLVVVVSGSVEKHLSTHLMKVHRLGDGA
jgi:pyruvate kinase